MIAPLPDPATVDRDKVGEFVRRSLPRRLEAIGCKWPLEVSWDADHIGATLVRGELVLRAWESRRPWWHPAEKQRGIDIAMNLATSLGQLFERFADADETGRRRIRITHAQKSLEVVLEPGVYVHTHAATSAELVYRYQVGSGVPWEQAVELGWISAQNSAHYHIT